MQTYPKRLQKVCETSATLRGIITADAVRGRELLAQAKLARLSVQANGERLSVRGSRDHEALIRRLIEHKPDVLAALTPAHPPDIDGSPAPSSSPHSDGWDEARAFKVQAAINAPIDAAVAAIPANHPYRQARLNVLANERGIVAALVEKRDPILWGWLDSLDRLLERWNETDRVTSPSTQQTTISEDR
jgi:hypothetical protein